MIILTGYSKTTRSLHEAFVAKSRVESKRNTAVTVQHDVTPITNNNRTHCCIWCCPFCCSQRDVLKFRIDALRVPALPSNKREGKKPTMSMNIFRLCGDMSHVFSILVLLLRLRVAKNAQGACAFRLLVNSPLLISHEDAYPVFHCSRNSCQSSRLQVFRCERMNSSSWSLLLGIWIYLRHSTPSTIP